MWTRLTLQLLIVTFFGLFVGGAALAHDRADHDRPAAERHHGKKHKKHKKHKRHGKKHRDQDRGCGVDRDDRDRDDRDHDDHDRDHGQRPPRDRDRPAPVDDAPSNDAPERYRVRR